jgi:hypothetical protein
MALIALAAAARAQNPFQAHRTENVIFVMTDGLRWQEVFDGAEKALIPKEKGDPPKVSPLEVKYWRETPEARREVLMPFLWTVVAKQGQIFGNQTKGSIAQVTNGHNFSYPGYNETLCGFADPRIDSNDKKPNPNVTVFEWLNAMPRYRGRVAAFGAWDVFPYIFNEERCGFIVNAGYEPMGGKRYEMLDRLKETTTRYWDGEPFDSYTLQTALEYFKSEKPRVFFVSLGETDEWAHEGRYDLYLESAHRADAALKTLWETAQSTSRYRGKTTLIFSPDHGRGDAPVEWKSHGEKTKGSENIFMAFMGPDTPALGERTQTERITQSQIAATLAAFLGEDYCAAVPKAGGPVPGVFGLQRK